MGPRLEEKDGKVNRKQFVLVDFDSLLGTLFIIAKVTNALAY